jgi:hypothetical protein
MVKLTQRCRCLLFFGISFLFCVSVVTAATKAPDVLKSKKAVVLNAAPEAKPLSNIPKKRLIFVNFYNSTGNPNTRYLESSIIEAIDELIRDKYHYDRVSGQEWQKFIQYGDFAPEDFYDTEKLLKIGYAFKADGIIFGKIESHPKGVIIKGKILSVVEKEVVAEKELIAPLSAELFESVSEISKALAGKIKDLFVPSDWGAVRRSALLPGWGQFYKQRSRWGYIWSIGVSASLLTSAYLTYAYVHNNSAYHNATVEDDTASLFEKADSSFGAMKIAWYITGGLYLLNLLDAYFMQGDYVSLRSAATAQLLPENLSIGTTAGSQGSTRPSRGSETYISISWKRAL